MAWAQGAPPAVGTAIPQGSPIPRILPPAPPAVEPIAPLVPPPAAAGSVPAAPVKISSVTVEGATAYPDTVIEPLTAGLTGPAVPLTRIEAARRSLVDLYRHDGYVLTTVTASVAANGALRFIVSEGHIVEVKLDGDIGPAGTQVLRFLNRLTEQKPISTSTIERWLLLAQDVPGVSLRAVLRPSTSGPGALTLIAQVERQAASGLLTVDNRAFRQTGPVEALAVLDLNSFTQFGEKTELSLYHTDGNTQNFGQVSTEAFVGDSGLRVRVAGGYGEATPSGSFTSIAYKGFTTVFGVTATYPLIRAREQTLNLGAALEAIESEVKTDAGRAGRDSLRVGRVSAEYAVEDLLLGADRSAINTALVRVSQGLPFLGGTHNGNPTPSRPGEKTDFTKVTFDVSRTQTLFSPWEGATVALRGRLVGQASSAPLPPAEKFYLGGIEYTRGFYSGEVTGDNAYAYSLELQLNTGFELNVLSHPIPVGAQFYVFYDRGQTYENRKEDPNVRLSSEGVGLRASVTRYTEFDIEGVVRNTRLPSGTQGIVKPLKADAAYWRVLTRF